MPDSISIRVETNQPATMRDGTLLYADVYRPDGPGPFPTILQRTPYDKTSPLAALMLDPMKAARAGFALVIQDTRGRYTSGGEFYCFVDDINDGYDTVEWAASQPWSSGRVGMIGASYVGATQWLCATSQPPHLAAIAPNVTASNYHDGWTYQGGAFELGFKRLLDHAPADPGQLQHPRGREEHPAGARRRVAQGRRRHERGLQAPAPERLPTSRGRFGRLFLRLAGTSQLRRLLEKAVHRGPAFQHQRTGAEHWRLVRHLPGRHHPKLPGHAGEGGPPRMPDVARSSSSDPGSTARGAAG